MKKTLLFILLFVATQLAISQSTEWKIFCNGEIINSLSQDSANNVIVGTAGGGLVLINKTSLAPTFIKKGANSIPSNQVNFVEGSLVNGVKWAATNKGFSYYLPDSSKWFLYNHDNIPEISLNRVTCAVGTNTDLFIGCDSYFDDFLNQWVYGGIARYNNIHGWTSNLGASDIHSMRVRCLAISPNKDKLFVGTMFGSYPPSGGFSYYNLLDSTWTWVHSGISGLPSDDINCIYFDNYNSAVLIGTEAGVAQHLGWDTLNDMNHWTVMDTSNSDLPDNHVTCIATKYTVSPTHQYWWVGTRYGGLYKKDTYDGIWDVFDTTNSLLKSNNITSITIDIDNPEIVWIGTDNGLFRFDQTTFTKITTSEYPIPSNYINDIDIDNNNNKWIATTNGLAKFKSNWTIYNPQNSGLKYTSPYCVYAENNDLWIGGNNNTDGPLCKYDGNNWNYFLGTGSGYPFLNSVFDVTSDNFGNKWIASNYGVFKYDNSYFVNWNATTGYPAALPSNYVKSILADNNDTIWIATGSGLAKNTNYPWDVFNPANSQIPSYNINALVQDDSSYYWIATDSGLAKFDALNNIWTVFDTASVNFPSLTVYDVDYEGDSLIWIASRKGIASFNRLTESWTNYNSDNSEMPEDVVNKIKVDPLGNKWICTKEGGLIEFKKGGIATSIKESGNISASNDIQIYPNPAKDNLIVHFGKTISEKINLGILNITGQTVYKLTNIDGRKNSVMELNVSQLENGVYFLNINNNKINVSKKFVIGR
ncbi:MAG: two-component regulator propeller domain-containing protein [Bacteroidales bacterium]